MHRTNLSSRILFMVAAVLLIFVVLSTATYAWYSMSSSVDAGGITFTADSVDAGGDLSIYWDEEKQGSRLEFELPEVLHPMIPIEQPSRGLSYDEFMKFNSTSQIRNGGVWIAKTPAEETEPATLTNEAGKKTFYLENKSESDFRVAVSYKIEGDLADQLRLAIFVGEPGSVSEESFSLLGIAAVSRDLYWGEIKKDIPSEPPEAKENSFITADGKTTIDLKREVARPMRFVIWLDGVKMLDKHGGKTANFEVSFQKTAPPSEE